MHIGISSGEKERAERLLCYCGLCEEERKRKRESERDKYRYLSDYKNRTKREKEGEVIFSDN